MIRQWLGLKFRSLRFKILKHHPLTEYCHPEHCNVYFETQYEFSFSGKSFTEEIVTQFIRVSPFANDESEKYIFFKSVNLLYSPVAGVERIKKLFFFSLAYHAIDTWIVFELFRNCLNSVLGRTLRVDGRERRDEILKTHIFILVIIIIIIIYYVCFFSPLDFHFVKFQMVISFKSLLKLVVLTRPSGTLCTGGRGEVVPHASKHFLEPFSSAKINQKSHDVFPGDVSPRTEPGRVWNRARVNNR